MHRDRPALMRLQVNPGKSCQRTRRSLHAADLLAHVELRHLRAFALAAVRHLEGDDDVGLAARGRSLNRDISVGEGRITQPEAEGEQWLTVAVVIRSHPRWVRVVEVGQLTHAAWESDGQPARWIVIAEECL